jgi:hypothetical protein
MGVFDHTVLSSAKAFTISIFPPIGLKKTPFSILAIFSYSPEAVFLEESI